MFTAKEKHNGGSFIGQTLEGIFIKTNTDINSINLFREILLFVVFSNCMVNCASITAWTSFCFRREIICKTSCKILVKSNWYMKGEKGNWQGEILRQRCNFK
jgi:hypothetical protein